MTKMLKYEFSQEEGNALLQMLNRVQIAGIQSAQVFLGLVQKIQNPLNAADLEKDQLGALKEKHEQKEEKKVKRIH